MVTKSLCSLGRFMTTHRGLISLHCLLRDSGLHKINKICHRLGSLHTGNGLLTLSQSLVGGGRNYRYEREDK